MRCNIGCICSFRRIDFVRATARVELGMKIQVGRVAETQGHIKRTADSVGVGEGLALVLEAG